MDIQTYLPVRQRSLSTCTLDPLITSIANTESKISAMSRIDVIISRVLRQPDVRVRMQHQSSFNQFIAETGDDIKQSIL